MMYRPIWKYLLIVPILEVLPAEAAVDSYRFLHVTIATPWYIFLFLLIGVLSPFVLMAFLMWRSLIRKSNQKDNDSDHPSSPE